MDIGSEIYFQTGRIRRLFTSFPETQKRTNENTVFLKEVLYSNENSRILNFSEKKNGFMFGIINYVSNGEF
ncbi:hypothetical protein EHQ12_13850 [Leptospira gomenensis]|uniref:Uncharacterized protein n=1 Tax=Leptospira gomenensis TaxID=2484974 RepID=A0A5F1YR13_9LEPT|nr:hypothetical protein EHQ17_18115 [Leptospira gomenensis]TGK37139.1 hypothetical protein EHQ12_13850 [Leptospira gomenensis]TGK45775.1 hypothetical protein EHQ07_08860 [Leptospira gomenensis]TGK59714.1 hypothetical protein EHQ13_13070 [Leptospira gomenensis]